MNFDKIVFVDESGTVVEYSPESHGSRIHKFLVWPDLIVTGSQDQHSELYAAFCKTQDAPPPTELIAAGNANWKGISAWWSAGYDFDTPEEMKPHVLAALKVADIS